MNNKDKTLEYYNTYATEFVNSTKNANMSDLYCAFEKYINPNAKILDLGCGSGRDSKYFMTKGYEVVATDGSYEVAKLASEELGIDVLCCKFEELEFAGEFDAIWACASLIHVPKDEIKDVIVRVREALKPEGILYASFKYGRGEGERNGRFFNDYTEANLEELFSTDNGFRILEWTITQDVRKGRSNEKWLNVIVERV